MTRTVHHTETGATGTVVGTAAHLSPYDGEPGPWSLVEYHDTGEQIWCPDRLLTADDNSLTVSDATALDALNLLLSADEWPGASGMEDVAEIVHATGRRPIPNAPEWPAH